MENAAVGGLICSASQHITSQDWLSLTQGNILSSTDLILKSFSAFTQIKMMATLAKAKATARERERERKGDRDRDCDCGSTGNSRGSCGSSGKTVRRNVYVSRTWSQLGLIDHHHQLHATTCNMQPPTTTPLLPLPLPHSCSGALPLAEQSTPCSQFASRNSIVRHFISI